MLLFEICTGWSMRSWARFCWNEITSSTTLKVLNKMLLLNIGQHNLFYDHMDHPVIIMDKEVLQFVWGRKEGSGAVLYCSIVWRKLYLSDGSRLVAAGVVQGQFLNGGNTRSMVYKGNRQITTKPVSLCYDFWARSGIQSPLSPWIPIFGGWLFSCNLCTMENCTAKNINIRPRVNLPPNILRSVDFWVRKWVKRARFSSVCRTSFPLLLPLHATTQDSEMYTP